CDSRAAEEGAEVEPAALLRDVHDDLGAAVPLQKLDPGGVDELLRLLVVGGQLDVDAGRAVDRLDLQLARVEAHLELDRACDWKAPLHLDLLSSGRNRTGACRSRGEGGTRWPGRSRERATRSSTRPRDRRRPRRPPSTTREGAG